jgi:2',3'-cyclic-nucleotide 2'-phosphodiesterase (5'-nucleotidase family)
VIGSRRSRVCVSIAFAAVFATLAIAPVTRAAGVDLFESDEPPDLFVLSTGEVVGYLDNCGCKQNPAGGLARRAWLIDKLRERSAGAPLLLVDSGNFSGSPSARGDAQTRALLSAMRTLGYRVVNVGERDVRQGYAKFAELTSGEGLTFLSSNIVRVDNQAPVFEPHTIVELPAAGGTRPYRVGIVGAARYNPIFREPGPAGTDMLFAHPTEPVRASVAALRAADVDLVVLLAAMHLDDVKRLITAVPGIDLVLGSYAAKHTDLAEHVGSTAILYTGDRGQRLGETRVYFDGEDRTVREAGRTHFLTDTFPPQKAMLDFVNSVVLPPVEGFAGGTGTSP